MPNVPIEIKVQKKQKRLVIEYSDKQSYELSFEYLRVHSPSAEVKGHGQEVLQLDKENVSIKSVLPVGNYAIKLIFDDGHDSGIYTWKYLQELGENKAKYWRAYLDRVKASRYTSI